MNKNKKTKVNRTSEKSRSMLLIFEGIVFDDEAEKIEDALSDLLQKRGHVGRIEDAITGNTTRF